MSDDVRCIERGSDCSGVVEYRPGLSATGQSFPRCDGHWSRRLDADRRDREHYPDSPIPPDWFDPSLAGERWDEDY